MNKKSMQKVCRCLAPPESTPFEKDDLYRWDYIIDGYVAFHESGEQWNAGEIEFYQHFQIMSGKHI